MDDEVAAKLLKTNDQFLILTHKQPDGDTIGCAAGLCQALRQMGKTAYIAPNEDAHALFFPYLEGKLAPPDFKPAFLVSVDTASEGMLTRSTALFAGRIDLSIDHHPSNEGYAKENWVDAKSAACGEMIYRLCCMLGPVTKEVALPLYVAVSTDTGCFAYSNTTPRTHRVAAALMETGIDYAWANKRHFRTKSYRRLKLESMIVEGLERYDDGRTVIACITLDMMAALGATERDVEDIAAFIGQLEGVKASVTLRQLRPGENKISLRTSGELNASNVCALLGGGGHAAAGGCTIPGTVEEAKTAILNAIRTIQHG